MGAGGVEMLRVHSPGQWPNADDGQGSAALEIRRRSLARDLPLADLALVACWTDYCPLAARASHACGDTAPRARGWSSSCCHSSNGSWRRGYALRPTADPGGARARPPPGETAPRSCAKEAIARDRALSPKSREAPGALQPSSGRIHDNRRSPAAGGREQSLESLGCSGGRREELAQNGRRPFSATAPPGPARLAEPTPLSLVAVEELVRGAVRTDVEVLDLVNA